MPKQEELSGIYKWAGAEDPWALVHSALEAGATRIHLSGAPGVGKSYAGLFSTPKEGQEVFQVSLSEDISVQELMGHFVPKNGLFEWHDGPCCQAARKGAVLVINELGRASDSVKDFLLGLLDDPKVARISLPTGETLAPTKGFKVVATSNSPVSELDPALQDRFEVIIHLDRPNPELIKKLNSALEGLGDAIRDSYKTPGMEIPPRRAMAFLALVKKGVEAKQAAAMTFGAGAMDFVTALKSRKIAV